MALTFDSDASGDIVMDDDAGSDYAPAAAVPAKAKAKPQTTRKKAAATSTKKTAATGATKTTAKAKKQLTLDAKMTTTKRPRSSLENDDPDGTDLNGHQTDSSALLDTPPKEKKQKRPPAPKKAASKALNVVENEGMALDAPEELPKKAGGATERYTKLTQLEHILKRPDTYIGSVERTESKMWVYNSQLDAMEMREVSFVPGLYKIFDEILVNAADNKQNDKNMDTIKVTIDRETGEISVWNNGRGIPIEIHEKEKIYIPELIFSHLLTSSNYDDNQQKVTGGRNGYGAKLCNIFSTTFTLETADSHTQKKYKQTWTNNMSVTGKAQLTSNKKDDYTKVTFTPDFNKFGMTGIDDDFEALVKRRVYDLAGTLHDVKVFLNGEKIKIRNFKQYMEMYVKAIVKENGDGTIDASNPTILTEQPDPRWEIGFAVSDGSFQQVSFVNSIATTSGGTHVNYIGDQIINRLLEHIKKKNKNGPMLKASQIRNHIFLFVNCQIVNPAFTSQTKEQLTTKQSQFGSKCAVSEDFLKKVAKSQAVANILHFAEAKADQILKRTDGHRRSRINNPKLVDANKAGTKDGWKCTLILTEGDSAKGLAMAGRAVVGPDEFGVFPLRGKLLNVRDASIDQISKNAEIQNIKQFLGLQHKKEYTDTRSLRYGHVMIMTDQDHDGSHIKGLLINFLQCAFPSLLRIPQFLIEFITPIMQVWKGDPKRPTKRIYFFTRPEYEAWAEAHRHERGWQHKYYKGLGTSTTEEAQMYFRDLDKHLKEFHTMQENEEKLIDLAFSKKKADERKEWLRNFQPGTYLDHTAPKITYSDFINKELILFSMADNMRSIPSVVDGLKPGQRKVLYTCFKKNLLKDRKVVELAGLVSGLTGYQHGETSLQQTIVGLAQTFVGSNNVNCLEPSGNYGSRLQGGSDCASARYIHTRLSPFARRLFSPLDEPLLAHNVDDGKQIEPELYCPTVPLILINGADGIGTGWSSYIPNYSPEDVVANLRRLMHGEAPVPMTPWYRGWTGRVEQTAPDRYRFNGIARQLSDTEVEITELPIRMWTQDFKDRLEEIIKADKVPSFIKDYVDYNTHVKVHFIVQMEPKHMKSALDEGLEEKFKLTKTLATSNLVAFDRHGRLHKYNTVEEILEEFYSYRLQMYEKRKAHQLAELQRTLEKLTNQARFIEMIISGELVVAKKKKVVLVAELKKRGFKQFPKVKDASKEGEDEEVVEDEAAANAGESADDADASAYDYLLGMAIWSLTQERVNRLRQNIGDTEHEIDVLVKLSAKDLWNRDLDDFLAEWRFQLEDESKREAKGARMGRRASLKLKVGAKGTAAKRGAKAKAGAADGDDDDDEDFVAAAAKPKKAATAAGGGGLKRVQPKTVSSFFTALQGTSSPKSNKPAAAAVPAKKPAAAADAVSAPATMAPLKDEEEEHDEFALPLSEPVAPPKKPVARKVSTATSRPAAPPQIINLDGASSRPSSPVPVPAATAAASKDSKKAAASRPAPPPTTQPAERKTGGRLAARKPVKYIESDSEEDDYAEDDSGKVAASKTNNGKGGDDQYDDDNDDADEEEDDDVVVRGRRGAAAAAAPRAPVSSSSAAAIFADGSSSPAPPQQPAVPTVISRPAPVPAAAPASATTTTAAAPAPAARKTGGRLAARKPVKYAVDISSSESDGDGEDEHQDEEDDGYEDDGDHSTAARRPAARGRGAAGATTASTTAANRTAGTVAGGTGAGGGSSTSGRRTAAAATNATNVAAAAATSSKRAGNDAGGGAKRHVAAPAPTPAPAPAPGADDDDEDFAEGDDYDYDEDDGDDYGEDDDDDDDYGTLVKGIGSGGGGGGGAGAGAGRSRAVGRGGTTTTTYSKSRQR